MSEDFSGRVPDVGVYQGAWNDTVAVECLAVRQVCP